MKVCETPTSEVKTYFPVENKTFDRVRKQYGDSGFIVIKGKEVLGVYPSREAGALAGNTKWGYEDDFLVKGLNPEDNIIRYFRYVP